MRSISRWLCVGVLAVMAMLFAVSPSALASGPGTGGGTVQLGPPTTIWQKTVGQNVISAQEGSLTFTGTIVGTGTLNVLANLSPTGTETFIGHWIAPAVVDGRSGVLEIVALNGRDNGTFSGTILARGVGGLAGLFGEGSFSGQDATGAGTYTFNYKLLGRTPPGYRWPSPLPPARSWDRARGPHFDLGSANPGNRAQAQHGWR
jgi:hypothetical protein